MITLKENTRINWIDQAKGFGIILVIYGHNFPVIEAYIYSFHMPLFFWIAGIFHPRKINLKDIKKRFQRIMVPYFLWSFILFSFWFFFGRKYGESALIELNPLDNFIGIFISQGGVSYMNWGIPMWFLPCLFLTYLFFGIILEIRNRVLKNLIIVLAIIIGFLIPKFFHFIKFWSFDVALVAICFYTCGYYFNSYFKKITENYKFLTLTMLFIIHLIFSLYLPQKIDMYRSVYDNELLFVLGAFSGILFWLTLIKSITIFKFLGFYGKNTIPILALQIRALTFIKMVLFLVLGIKIFEFTEVEKIILIPLQLLLIYPIIILTNKYIPLLNGKSNKK